MKTLLYTTYSWNVTNSKSIFQHIDFIPGQIDILTNHQSLKFSFDNPRFFGRVGNEIFEDYLTTYKDAKTWKEYYDKIDVSQYKDYDNIYVIAPPTYGLYNMSDEKFNKCYFQYENLLNSNRDLKFNSHGLPLLHMMVLIKASREFKIPFFQYNFEVTGIDFSRISGLEPFEYQMFHGYRYRDLSFATTLQDYYVKHSKKDQFDLDFLDDSPQNEKSLDFSFCYYTFEKQNQKHRQSAIDDLKGKILPKIDSSKMFFYEYVKENKELKTIPRDEYLDKISKSRFTYIIPSFQYDVFSIDRFIDSIANDCLPLIHPLTYRKDVEETYNVDLSPLVTFEFPNEDKRLELLDYLKDKMLNVSKLPNLKGK